MLQKRIQIDGVTIPASNDQLRLRRQSEERIHLASPKRLHNAVLHLEHLTRTRPIERARVVPRLLVEAPKHRTPHRDNNQDRIAPPAGIVQQSRQRGLRCGAKHELWRVIGFVVREVRQHLLHGFFVNLL